MSSRYRYRRNYNNYARRIGASRRRPFSSGSNSLVKRARGNMRAANNQNDVSNVVINLMHTVYAGTSAYFENHDAEAYVDDFPDSEHLHHIGTCAVNIYDLLMKSDFFSSYSGMYDQFRINSIKVKVTPVQWSVFDQSRSSNNLVALGSKYNASVENIQSTRIPSPDEYVINPEFNPDEQESEMNPRYIVPGIDVKEYLENEPNGQNEPVRVLHKYSYVLRPHGPDAPNTPFLQQFPDDIKYIVNVRSGPNNRQDGGDGTFPEGIITGLTQSKSNQIPIETFAKESYQYPQALTIVTAWDRTGLNEAQIDLIEPGETFWPINDSTGEASRVDLLDEENIEERYIVCTIGDDISSYSSASTKQLVGGASFNLTRYLYPSSQQEKSTYYSTSSLIEQQNKDDVGGSHYIYKLVENGWSKDTLTNLYESAVVPFKPTFLLGILGHNEVDADNFEYTNQAGDRVNDIKTFQMIKPVKFNLEFDIGVTFRGLRKVQVV